MAKILGVVGTEFGFHRGQRAHDTLDFAQRVADQLVDAAVESERPTAMNQCAFDRHFELHIGAQRAFGSEFFFGASAQFIVPMLAELGTPDALSAPVRFLRAESEAGEIADTQADGFGFEGELHGMAHGTHGTHRREAGIFAR